MTTLAASLAADRRAFDFPKPVRPGLGLELPGPAGCGRCGRGYRARAVGGKPGAGRVTILAMGDQGVNQADEDEHCALYLRNRLEGRNPDPEALRKLIMAGGQGAIAYRAIRLIWASF